MNTQVFGGRWKWVPANRTSNCIGFYATAIKCSVHQPKVCHSVTGKKC